MSDPEIVYAEDPQEEFGNIQRARTQMRGSAWELGCRLEHSYRTKQFLETELKGRRPKDWTDFLTGFIDVSPAQAYRYQDAAYWPRWISIRVGTEKAALLRRITMLTAVDETPEQAFELVLPLASGEKKSFAAMSYDEVQEAYKVMKAGRGQADRPGTEQPAPDDSNLRRLKSIALQVLTPYLKQSQVRVTRTPEGEYVMDLIRMPFDKLSSIIAALSRIPV